MISYATGLCRAFRVNCVFIFTRGDGEREIMNVILDPYVACNALHLICFLSTTSDCYRFVLSVSLLIIANYCCLLEKWWGSSAILTHAHIPTHMVEVDGSHLIYFDDLWRYYYCKCQWSHSLLLFGCDSFVCLFIQFWQPIANHII